MVPCLILYINEDKVRNDVIKINIILIGRRELDLP
jgi:hypothetical protein